MLFNFRQVF